MNLPGGNDGNPPGRTELTSIRLRALAATHMPFIAPHLVAWPRPHGTVVCHTPCYVRRIRTSSALRTAILCGSRYTSRCPRCPGNDVNRFMCVPGQISLSRFSISPLFEQPGQKHPRKIANSALPHNIRHHTSAEFRASGFAYIERSRDGLSRFPKRGQNHEPGQRNLARFARQSVAVTTGTPTAHR